MTRNNIFNISTSPLLNNLDYWITTNSKSIFCNYLPVKNLLSVNIGNENIIYINLNTNEVELDINHHERFAFFLSSKGKIYLDKKFLKTIFSDFDTLGIMLNYTKLNIGELKKVISSSYNKFLMLHSIEDKTNAEIVLIHRNKFYLLHEVCFLRSNMHEVDNYISYIINKLNDFSEEDIWKIKTILYEVFDNAIEHGNNFDKNKLIKSEILINNNGFYLEVSDQGQGFGIDIINRRPDTENKTGRGLLMIRKLSDILAIKNRGTTIGVFIPRSNAYQINHIA